MPATDKGIFVEGKEVSQGNFMRVKHRERGDIGSKVVGLFGVIHEVIKFQLICEAAHILEVGTPCRSNLSIFAENGSFCGPWSLSVDALVNSEAKL